MPSAPLTELEVLCQAMKFHRWRWAAQRKRLMRAGRRHRFDLHLEELAAIHKVWQECRYANGYSGKVTGAPRRTATKLLARRCRRVLKEIQNHGEVID